MLNRADKTNPFKQTKATDQLDPGYLYDIDLITKTKSWIKPVLRNNQSFTSKHNSFV